MQFKVLLLTLMASFKTFACTDAMKPYAFECKAQDKYTKLSQEYLKNHIPVTSIKGFVIPRALGKASYFSSKNEFLNETETTLANNKDWISWNAGQKFIAGFDRVFLDLSDVLKLHKTMFSTFEFGAGRIRTSFGETNPTYHFSCNDQLLDDNSTFMIENFDVKSNEGYALLKLDNLVVCEDHKNFSGDLIFYKGASMKMELKSWIADFNDMVLRYSAQTTENNTMTISPYQYLSDMKRWFISIHPFTRGNELVANVLIDYATEKLQLPPLALIYSHSYLKTIADNRAETLEATQDSLNLLENCLYETKVNLVSPQCSSFIK